MSHDWTEFIHPWQRGHRGGALPFSVSRPRAHGVSVVPVGTDWLPADGGCCQDFPLGKGSVRWGAGCLNGLKVPPNKLLIGCKGEKSNYKVGKSGQHTWLGDQWEWMLSMRCRWISHASRCDALGGILSLCSGWECMNSITRKHETTQNEECSIKKKSIWSVHQLGSSSLPIKRKKFKSSKLMRIFNLTVKSISRCFKNAVKGTSEQSPNGRPEITWVEGEGRRGGKCLAHSLTHNRYSIDVTVLETRGRRSRCGQCWFLSRAGCVCCVPLLPTF